MRAMEGKDAKKKQERENSRDPTAARHGYGNAGEDNGTSITNKYFSDVVEAASQSVGKSKRQKHFEKSAEVIRADVSTGPAMGIGLNGEPDAIGVGEVLINSITGDGHGKENESEDDDWREFLAVEVVENGKKENGVNEDTNEFLSGNIFDIGGKVTTDSVNSKSKDGPTDRQPKELGAWIKPKSRTPEHEDGRSETLNDQKREGIYCAIGQRPENQNGKNQAKDAALAATIQKIAIHSIRQILAWIRDFPGEGAGGNRSWRSEVNL